MDHVDIQQRLDALAGAMSSKGLRAPRSTMHLKSHEEISVGGSWKDESRTFGDAFHYVRGDTPEEALAEFEAYVEALPSPEEARHQEFMTALGRVIDLGRENGIDVDYVNPLVETMKRLSENAITHQAAE